jgi:hypothetical protein
MHNLARTHLCCHGKMCHVQNRALNVPQDATYMILGPFDILSQFQSSHKIDFYSIVAATSFFTKNVFQL